MGVLQLEKTYHTLEEYSVFETQSESKHEYHDGLLFEMSGGTSNHSKIAMSIATAIDNAFVQRGKDCSVFNSDMKIFIEAFNHVVYPDSMVICGEEKYHEVNDHIVINPSLIIEVLSKSTKTYDKGLKFEKYRTLPSFREYVLIWQPFLKFKLGIKKAKTYGVFLAHLD